MTTGLREQKKHQTRRHIADTAWRLFAARGFDEVTVDEVADAAGVSKKTVFNYFAAKEDLVFDHAEHREAAVIRAVRRVTPELPLVDSFELLFLESLSRERLDRLRRKDGSGSGGFFDMVHGNPALMRRLHELNAQLGRVLATELAGSRSPDDPLVWTTASALLGAQSGLHRSLRRRVAAGQTDAGIRRAHRRDVERVCAALRHGLD